jgi:hypothetical protein
LKKAAKVMLASLGFGVLITILPLLLGSFFWADWLKRIVAFIDWPMLLVLRRYPRLVRGNELDRAISFFMINVVTWAVLAMLIIRVAKGPLIEKSSNG